MKASLVLVFVAIALSATLRAHAKDDDLRTLEYQFSTGRQEIGILSKIQSTIEKELTVIDYETFKESPKSGEGVDCLKLSKGRRRDSVTYVCSTTREVFDVMADTYYASLDAKSPVNDVSLSISAVALSCSFRGCGNATHPGRQPCFLVFDGGVYCRHSPYTAEHNCLFP